MSFSDRRARRRYARDLQRRLEELDRIDRVHGLGAHPSYATRKRPRRQHGPVLPGLLIATILATGVLLRDPGPSGSRLRSLVGIGDTRLGDFIAVPDGEGRFEFAMTQPGSAKPVGWNPCQPIRYVVNPEGAPEGHEDMVRDSVATISDATGLRFEYDGITDDRTFERRMQGVGRTAPVLIGWSDENEIPRLAGDVAGLGGSGAVDAGPRRLTYVTGMIALDRDAFAVMQTRPDSEELQRAVVLHELAHVVGMAHVDDPTELMYDSNLGRTTFGPGDLEGLARLGGIACS